MSIDAALIQLPDGCRFHVGHTPSWHRRNELPKHLRKRPFEAYVVSGEIGTPSWVFESADGATPAEALSAAIEQTQAKLASSQPKQKQ